MVVYTNLSYTDKKREKRRRWKLRFLFLFTAFILCGAAYSVFFTDIFRFKEVKIEGSHALEEKEIFNVASHPFFWERINISNFGLGSVDIKKDFFRRVLTIDVKERVRYGVLCNEKSISPDMTDQKTRCFWFDEGGILFAEAPKVDGILIPQIRDFSSRQIKIGDQLLEERFTSNVLKIFEIFKKSDIAIKGLKIKDITKQEVEAELLDGPVVYFSMRFDPAFAFSVLESLKTKMNGLSHIDLRSENKVFYR